MSASILIVEDDPVLLRGLCDKFRARGYDVSSAGDGESGLREALAGSFHLIVLDVMLPRMNGFDVCLQLRRRKIATPILMLTAKGQESDIVHGLELGADDYVTKPFGARELLARAGALLRRADGNAEAIFHFGEFTLDRQARKLTREGEKVALTSKEYALLDCLTRRPGRAFTRSQLLNEVWGRSALVTGRSVDRCVTTLRAKIESDTRAPHFIVTIRDVGYRFDAPSEE
jgi:DNA-binding response OmpR family regulator